MGLKAASPSLLVTPAWVVEMDMSEGRAISHRDLARLQEWASKNSMKLNEVWLGSSLAERPLGLLVDTSRTGDSSVLLQ